MDKRIKWGIVALIGIGLIGLAIHTFVPRTNDELAEVEQQKPTTTKKNSLNVNAQIIKPHLLTDKLFVSGKLIPDEEVDLSFETSGKIVDIFFVSYRPNWTVWKPRCHWPKTVCSARMPCSSVTRSARKPTNR